MHQYAKELQSLADKLKDVHTEAGKLPPAMGAVTIRCQNQLLLLQNFVNGIAGLAMVTHGQADSEPLTSILGEPVGFRKPVEPQDIQPTNMERNKFMDDRDNMYAVFTTLTIDQISGKKGKPGGEAVIRAVAKKAGYEDYKDGKINTIYIEAVKKLIIAEKETQISLEKAAQSLP